MTDHGNFLVQNGTELCLGKSKDSSAVGLLKCEHIKKDKKKINEEIISRQHWLVRQGHDLWQLSGDCDKCMGVRNKTEVCRSKPSYLRKP